MVVMVETSYEEGGKEAGAVVGMERGLARFWKRGMGRNSGQGGMSRIVFLFRRSNF